MGEFKILPLGHDVTVPTYRGDGYDVYANEDVEMTSHVPCAVGTGIRMSFPPSHCALLTSHKIKVLGGMIDSDYRGEIKVILVSGTNCQIRRGEVIAKLQMLEIATPEIMFDQEYPDDARTDIK